MPMMETIKRPRKMRNVSFSVSHAQTGTVWVLVNLKETKAELRVTNEQYNTRRKNFVNLSVVYADGFTSHRVPDFK